MAEGAGGMAPDEPRCFGGVGGGGSTGVTGPSSAVVGCASGTEFASCAAEGEDEEARSPAVRAALTAAAAAASSGEKGGLDMG